VNNHPDCYGTLLPDVTRLEKNMKLESPAFSALVVSHGIGVQNRAVEVKRDGWEKCTACPDYRTCYDLSLARLLMNTVLVNGWYGS
jgi:hypothetical protein